MGVKDLWPILSSVQCHKPLTELRGKRIAIDLAIWVCEVQAVRMAGVHKPHLRYYSSTHGTLNNSFMTFQFVLH